MRNPLARLLAPVAEQYHYLYSFGGATLITAIVFFLLAQATALGAVSFTIGASLGAILYSFATFDVWSHAQHFLNEESVKMLQLNGALATMVITFYAAFAGMIHGVGSGVYTFIFYSLLAAFWAVVPVGLLAFVGITALQAIAHSNNESVRATAHQLFFANVHDTNEESLREEVRGREVETERA